MSYKKVLAAWWFPAFLMECYQCLIVITFVFHYFYIHFHSNNSHNFLICVPVVKGKKPENPLKFQNISPCSVSTKKNPLWCKSLTFSISGCLHCVYSANTLLSSQTSTRKQLAVCESDSQWFCLTITLSCLRYAHHISEMANSLTHTKNHISYCSNILRKSPLPQSLVVTSIKAWTAANT